MSADMTWGEMMNEVLDTHEVRESLAEVLLWEDPGNSALWFGAGVAMYVMVDVFEIGLMTIIGSIAILQLLVFRISSFLQEKGMAFDDVNLKEKLVLTPEPSSVSKTVEVLGDIFRIVEESIKELSLTSDYTRLTQGFCVLLFLSAVGRVVSLPVLLLISWVVAFVAPSVYVRNQERIDRLMDKSLEATEMFLESTKSKSKVR